MAADNKRNYHTVKNHAGRQESADCCLQHTVGDSETDGDESQQASA